MLTFLFTLFWKKEDLSFKIANTTRMKKNCRDQIASIFKYIPSTFWNFKHWKMRKKRPRALHCSAGLFSPSAYIKFSYSSRKWQSNHWGKGSLACDYPVGFVLMTQQTIVLGDSHYTGSTEKSRYTTCDTCISITRSITMTFTALASSTWSKLKNIQGQTKISRPTIIFPLETHCRCTMF